MVSGWELNCDIRNSVESLLLSIEPGHKPDLTCVFIVSQLSLFCNMYNIKNSQLKLFYIDYASKLFLSSQIKQ